MSRLMATVSQGRPHLVGECAQLLGDLSAVSGHGEDPRGDGEADTPGEGGPDVGVDRLLGEQVDDGGHRLVFGEGAQRADMVAVGTNAALRNGRKMTG
jgi:hypothetical protein